MSGQLAAIGRAIASTRHSSPRRAQRLGASHTAWDDPETPPQVLAAMVEREPHALTNPNLPFSAALRWAWRYPQYIEQNPALDMFGLEDENLTGQGAKLLNELNGGWVGCVLGEMPEADRYRLNIQFARQVLPLYEKTFDDGEARNVLNEALRYLQGAYDTREGEVRRDLFNAREKATAIIDDLHSPRDEMVAAYALLAAGRVFEKARPDDAETTAGAARHALAYAAGVHDISDRDDQPLQMSQADTDAFYNKARAWQADQVRAVYWAAQRVAARQATFERITKAAAENAKKAIEEEQRKTATKAQIAKAVKQAKAAASKIQAIMQEEDTESWPLWVGLGVLATGCVVALVIGPEALVAYGVAGAAETIIGIAEASAVRTVAIEGLASSEVAASWLELAVKLRAAGLVVAPAAVEVAKVVNK